MDEAWYCLVTSQYMGSFTSDRVVAYSRDIEKLKAKAQEIAKVNLDWKDFDNTIYANKSYVHYSIGQENKILFL